MTVGAHEAASLPPGAWRRWRTHLETNHGTWRGWVRATLAEAEYGMGRLDAYLAPDLAQTRRLVFVCLGNINRSAFAGAVGQSLGLHCVSIGLSTTAGAPATDQARLTARALGLSLDDHRATPLSSWVRAPGDLMLVMEVRHARRLQGQGLAPSRIALLGHHASPRRLHLHDPHELSLAYFRSSFCLIRSAVEGLAEGLRRSGSPAAGP